MRTVGILRELKIQRKYTKFNLVLYLISISLWMLIVSFSFVKLFYNPILRNGLFLEISIMSIFICGYLFLRNKKLLDYLEAKEKDIRLGSK